MSTRTLLSRSTRALPKKTTPFITRQPTRTMAAGSVSTEGTTGGTREPSFSAFHIKNTNINEAPGVSLSTRQKLVVGSVLDLFEGNPTLKHLSLWSPEATFADPITIAKGYDKFAAQWYGLPAVFSPIRLQSHTVTSSGNPVELDMSNKYVVKGIKKEQIMHSKVIIHLAADGKIERVEDKWDGKLPDGSVSEAFRKLNAVTVPALVKVPKNDEEDMKLKAAREESKSE